jgi:hypothetical protein
MTKASLSFGALEHALANYFQVPPAGIARFRARIKQLQRLEFPAGVNVGRGVKMPYGTEHLLKLILAFELIDAGLTASPATRIVELHWEKFRAGIAAAAVSAKHSSAVYATIAPHMMDNIAGEASRVTIDDQNSRLNLEQDSLRGTITQISIILTVLFSRLRRGSMPTDKLPTFFIAMEIKEWGQALPEYEASGHPDWFRLGQYNVTGVLENGDT